MNKISIFILFVFITTYGIAQSFTEQTGFSFVGINEDNMEWGDYDNDGYLDFVVCAPYPRTLLYHSDGDTSFTPQYNITLAKIDHADADWGDYNNDGFLDLIISGRDSNAQAVTILYKNNGDNTFTDQKDTILLGAYSGSTKWGDYDNDGDLDLLIVGYNINGYVAKVYNNNGLSSSSAYSFTEETNIHLQGIWKGAADWVDYNNDGDLDIIISGDSSYYNPMTKIYKNNGDNSFSELDSIGIESGLFSSLNWGDYDNDGDLDLAIIGSSNTGYFTKIYKNEGSDRFEEQTNISLLDYAQGVIKWVDYDNDGDLDLFVSGYYYPTSSHSAILYRNDGNNVFIEVSSTPWIGYQVKSADWADFDNDGDIDVIMTGDLAGAGIISKLYKNNLYSDTNSTIANTKPYSPIGLSSSLIGDSLLLTWNRAFDSTTPNIALKYNLRIGSSSNNVDIKSPNSDINTGFHRLSNFGAIQDTFYYLKIGDEVVINWSVQTLDNGFLASDFSLSDSIIITANTIKALSELDKYFIYPNPANHQINISGNGILEINIYNINGVLIYSKSTPNNNIQSINIENFQKGIYIISIVSEDVIYNKKIIIN